MFENHWSRVKSSRISSAVPSALGDSHAGRRYHSVMINVQTSKAVIYKPDRTLPLEPNVGIEWLALYSKVQVSNLSPNISYLDIKVSRFPLAITLKQRCTRFLHACSALCKCANWLCRTCIPHHTVAGRPSVSLTQSPFALLSNCRCGPPLTSACRAVPSRARVHGTAAHIIAHFALCTACASLL
jgi:hypothetical protein